NGNSLARTVRLVDFAVVSLCLGLLYSRRAADWTVPIALTVATATLLSVALICFHYREAINPAMLTALLTLGASGLLPWSWRAQSALALVSLATIAGYQLALGRPLQPFEGLAVATACVSVIVSVPQARTHEHARVKAVIDELLRRRAESQLRNLNEALEQKVE